MPSQEQPSPQLPDYSFLDQPAILSLVFYPRRDWSPPPPGARDYAVPIEGKVAVHTRFYPIAAAAPTLLYFHGNGEVVSDYNDIAHVYNHQARVNLWVADYRGYGRSGGSPSFSALFADAHTIYAFARKTLAAEGYTGPLAVMGRSLGSYAAVDLALAYEDKLACLIIESGVASTMRLFRRLGGVTPPPAADAMERRRADGLRSLRLPVLIIHGEVDSLIPLSEAIEFHGLVGSPKKDLLIIPDAGHNDLLYRGMDLYFEAIKRFVSEGGRA